MKSFNRFTACLLTSLLLVSVDAQAANSYGVSDYKVNEIETRIQDMNYDQLVATRKSLITEQANLKMLQENTESPAQNLSLIHI